MPAARRSLARSLAAGGACALALAAWLLMPWRPGRESAPLRAIVVDASASVTRLRPGWEAWVRGVLDAELAQAAERGEDALVLVYAKDVLAASGPAPAASVAAASSRPSRPWPRIPTTTPSSTRISSTVNRSRTSGVCIALAVSGW